MRPNIKLERIDKRFAVQPSQWHRLAMFAAFVLGIMTACILIRAVEWWLP